MHKTLDHLSLSGVPVAICCSLRCIALGFHSTCHSINAKQFTLRFPHKVLIVYIIAKCQCIINLQAAMNYTVIQGVRFFPIFSFFSLWLHSVTGPMHSWSRGVGISVPHTSPGIDPWAIKFKHPVR